MGLQWPLNVALLGLCGWNQIWGSLGFVLPKPGFIKANKGKPALIVGQKKQLSEIMLYYVILPRLLCEMLK